MTVVPPETPAFPPSLQRPLMAGCTTHHKTEDQNIERSDWGSNVSPAVPVSGLPRARRRAEEVLQQQTPDSGLEGAQKAAKAPGMLP
jgi:hypothetical protein